MRTKKTLEERSIADAVTQADPTTCYFYEHDGERSVEPLELVESGIHLWEELVFQNEAHDNRYLWDFAESLLQDRRNTLPYSSVEWLKYQIMIGHIVPAEWRQDSAFPYKGLLISAIYFQEARQLCLKGKPDRAWHLIAVGHYHLGTSTPPTPLQLAARAAKVKHLERSWAIRAMVLGVLKGVDPSTVKSIEDVKEKVVAAIRLACTTSGEIDTLVKAFDDQVSARTKGRTTGKFKNDVFERLRNMLDNWALPSGPYPDISKAFSRFSNRKRGGTNSATGSTVLTEQSPAQSNGPWLRLISNLESGHVRITTFSPLDDT